MCHRAEPGYPAGKSKGKDAPSWTIPPTLSTMSWCNYEAPLASSSSARGEPWSVSSVHLNRLPCNHAALTFESTIAPVSVLECWSFVTKISSLHIIFLGAICILLTSRACFCHLSSSPLFQVALSTFLHRYLENSQLTNRIHKKRREDNLVLAIITTEMNFSQSHQSWRNRSAQQFCSLKRYMQRRTFVKESGYAWTNIG